MTALARPPQGITEADEVAANRITRNLRLRLTGDDLYYLTTALSLHRTEGYVAGVEVMAQRLDVKEPA